MRLSITGLDVHFPAFFGLFFSRSFSPRHSPPEDQEALFQEIVTQVWHSVPSCCGEFAVMTWPHGVAAWCGCTVWLHGVALYSSMDSSDGERRHFEQPSGFEVKRDLISHVIIIRINSISLKYTLPCFKHVLNKIHIIIQLNGT